MQIIFRIFYFNFTKNDVNFEANIKIMTHFESLLKAEEEIKPYLSLFKICYENAIEKYNHWLDFFAAPSYNRTKAITFHNIIVNEIKRLFYDMPGVQIIEKYESISMVINNHISARFKKFNKKGLPSNHKSIRNDSIISQQLEITFEEYPPIARIDVGYNMDATGMNYDLLKVICRKNDDIIWDLYFKDIEDTGNSDIAITAPTNAPDATPVPSRIQINNEHKKAK
jgi:hypothetical protein